MTTTEKHAVWMVFKWILLLGPWLAPAVWAEDTLPAGIRPDTIGAGYKHTCGIRSNDTITCWGDNGSGQTSPPTGTFTHLSAGLRHNCAVRSNGTIACWGDNSSKQAAQQPGTFT